MIAELQLKTYADRLAAAQEWTSPDEITEALIEGLARNGKPLGADAEARARYAAESAVRTRQSRRTAGMADPDWYNVDIDAIGPAALPLLDPADWAGAPVPQRRWLLDEWIPEGTTTLFTGAGGVGKSLLAQQLATHVAMGLDFMGVRTTPGVALYLTCEDDAEELHRRQAAICDALRVPLGELSGRLHLASLIDECAPLAIFDRDGAMSVSSAFDRLRATVEAAGVSFLVLDNVAQLFGGNEIVKVEVAAFLALVNKLASRCGCTVLLLGHPNKAGDEYSGNVAWENQVRSRVFLDNVRNSTGGVDDQDARVLSRGKANYAKKGETLDFRWHRWAFIQEDTLPADQQSEVVAGLVASKDDAAFLACLDAATKQRQNVSHKPSANYAPKLFAKMPEGAGRNKIAYERAMRRLISRGLIEVDAELWLGPNRHMRCGIRRAPDCATPSGANA